MSPRLTAFALFSDATADELKPILGENVVIAAPRCRGLSQLAARRIHEQQVQWRQTMQQQQQQLPSGTRNGDGAASLAGTDAR